MRKRRQTERQIRTIEAMSKRHEAEYKRVHEEIQKACQRGDYKAIEKLTAEFENMSKKFIAEIDAEAAIINQDMEQLGINRSPSRKARK